MKQKRIFSFYTYYKLTLWSLILLSSIFIAATFFSDDSIVVSVKPAFGSKYYDSAIIQFKESKLLLRGALVINNPTMKEKIFLPHELSDFNFIRNLFVIISCLLLLRILPSIRIDNLFKEDISKLIVTVGVLIVAYSFLEVVQSFLATKIIKAKTDGYFLINQSSLQNLLFIVGAVVIWFGKTYKKAFDLKQEQDLTI